MSSLNLNLLPSRAKFQAAKIKLQNKVKMIIVFMVVGWVAVAGVTLGLYIFSRIRVNTVQAQYDKAKSEYMAMSDNIVTSQRLKYKAKLVGGVLKNRFEYGKAFETIKNLFPEGIKMVSFELKKKGEFNIKGETSGRENVNTLESIIDNINGGRNDNFSTIKLTSLVLTDSIWTFEMEVGMR